MNEPYDGKSTNPAVPGVSGENTGGGDGISGTGARNGAVGQTSNPGASGVFGLNTGGGFGVAGDSTTGTAVLGRSVSGKGVLGTSNSSTAVEGQSESGVGVRAHSNHANGIEGFAHDPNGQALLAINDAKTAPTLTDGSPHGCGVLGVTTVPGAAGVFGANNSAKGVGVQGNGPEVGVSGFSQQGAGLRGISQSSASFGIFGSNDSPNAPTGGGAGGAGVFGLSVSPGGAGVFGANNSDHGVGVQGNGPEAGISGFSENGAGVVGRSAKNGVVGQTRSDTDAGVNGRNDGNGFGVFGGSLGGSGVEGHSTNGNGVVGFSEKGLAGRFIGDVEVTGDIRLQNADCAEDFDIAEVQGIEPGTVMVVGDEGVLHQSSQAYDKCVAGVISGAGDYKPGIVLDKQPSAKTRKPIALLGKVFCKVDAQYGAVKVGDLLTTSPTPGHAMKADDPLKAFGAVIGKALRPLTVGQGLIPILIALQ